MQSISLVCGLSLFTRKLFFLLIAPKRPSHYKIPLLFQFVIQNRSLAPLHLRLHSIPFTHQKVQLNPLKVADCVLPSSHHRSSSPPVKESPQTKTKANHESSSAKINSAASGVNDRESKKDDGIPLLMWNQQADLCVAGSAPTKNVLYFDFSFDG